MTAPRTDDRPAGRDGRGTAAGRSRGGRGFEIVLVAVYGIFALSARWTRQSNGA